MRKTAGVVIIIYLVMGLFSLSLPAQVQKFRVRVVTEQANIRVKPDISSEMLFQIPEGTELEAEKKEGEWFLVLFEKADGTKGQGYVHESLVEVVSPERPPVATKVRPEKPIPPKKEEPVQKERKPELKPEKKAETTGLGTTATTVFRNLSIAVYGGGAYVSASDLNQAASGVAQYYFYALGYNGQSEFKALHLAFIYGLDVFYQINPDLYLGLGFDYFEGAKKNQTDFAVGSSSYSVVTRPGIKDLPLRLSLLYQAAELFYLRLGVEYHLAKANYLYRVAPNDTWVEWRGTASGHSLGWVEAAGVQWSAASWCQLFFEGSYRYARVKNFHGKNIYSDSTGLNRTEEGQLYYFLVQVSPSVSYPALFIRDRVPSELGVINPRKADINYSGFSLKAGLRFKF
jgi:hypothetical protein